MAIPFRPSSLSERSIFYDREFSITKVKNYFKKNKIKLPQICALDAGTETGIIINKKLKNMMLYLPFSELKEKIKKYIPEDVYYDRNTYLNPKKVLKNLNFNSWISQELVFDIDSDNIKCTHKRNQPLCKECLKKAYKSAIRMKKQLKGYFKRIVIVYSGRGFHIHILDKKSYNLSIKEREKLNRMVSKFPIDPWVSKGYIRLIRMPYSLNSLISRKVIPLNKKDKLNDKDTIPNFLKIEN
jgi:DNA primase catalytic subunit